MNPRFPSVLSTLLALAGLCRPALAQAPASADLWRLATASLAAPPALEGGATGAFWNPAGAWSEVRMRAGAEVLQTPDVVGVTGLLGGLTYRLSRGLAVALLVGRNDVGDLVRTTTSPTSELGPIPVFEQLAGVGASARRGPFALGALLRGHNARFDAERDQGLTLDVGLRFAVQRLTLAAATHFFPLNLTDRRVTDYYGAGEYRLASPTVWGTAGRLFIRYGVSARQRQVSRGKVAERAAGGVEHALGGGLELAERFRLDGNVTHEEGYADAAWRPAVGVRFRVGRYSIAASRASGLGGTGASYRIGLDVDVLR